MRPHLKLGSNIFSRDEEGALQNNIESIFSFKNVQFARFQQNYFLFGELNRQFASATALLDMAYSFSSFAVSSDFIFCSYNFHSPVLSFVQPLFSVFGGSKFINCYVCNRLVFKRIFDIMFNYKATIKINTKLKKYVLYCKLHPKYKRRFSKLPRVIFK